MLAAAILGGDDWRARLVRHDDPLFESLAAKIEITVNPVAEARFPERVGHQ